MILVDHNYSIFVNYGHQVPKEKQKFKEVRNQQQSRGVDANLLQTGETGIEHTRSFHSRHAMQRNHFSRHHGVIVVSSASHVLHAFTDTSTDNVQSKLHECELFFGP